VASNKKTTSPKLNREQKLGERRVEKRMRRDAGRLAAAGGQPVVAAATDESISGRPARRRRRSMRAAWLRMTPGLCFTGHWRWPLGRRTTASHDG
jgi:hypothetical protein